MNLVWSPIARRQANAAVDFIKRDRPDAAERWLAGLLERVELLRELPEQGRVVPEWDEPTVREILFEPYRVVYEVCPDRVEVITLSHFRQLLPPERV